MLRQPPDRRGEDADQPGDRAAHRPAEADAPDGEDIGDLPWCQLVDIGGAERQQHAQAQAREKTEDAERDEGIREDRGREREDAGDPDGAQQRGAAADAIGDHAMAGRADQEAHEPARDQQPRLGRLQPPGAHDVMDDIGWIEGVEAVEHGQ
ncbi:MAG TPA: hypothetical protein VHY57_05350 [Rhizomicrobium sp.]|nr:hypothetical protein [Rhizomicrobium sp.]